MLERGDAPSYVPVPSMYPHRGLCMACTPAHTCAGRFAEAEAALIATRQTCLEVSHPGGLSLSHAMRMHYHNDGCLSLSLLGDTWQTCPHGIIMGMHPHADVPAPAPRQSTDSSHYGIILASSWHHYGNASSWHHCGIMMVINMVHSPNARCHVWWYTCSATLVCRM